jgi:cysteinyl-tRNA synthetase
MRYLGETLDIHGGGLDLQFPHHENELAQSESYTDKTFSRYWMHNGLLKMGDKKMAGSVGNVVNIRDLISKFSGEVIRFLILNSHYRSPIDFNNPDERLAETQRSLDAFYRFFERYEETTGRSFFSLRPFDVRDNASRIPGSALPDIIRNDVIPKCQAFVGFMDDDFNTAGAIAVLFDFVRDLNRFADVEKLDRTSDPEGPTRRHFDQATLVLKELSQILGLFIVPPPKRTLGGDDALVAGLMQLLIDIRNNLRAEAKKIAAKDDPVKKALFEQTDVIRKRLGEIGVTLEDRPGGTGWRIG